MTHITPGQPASYSRPARAALLTLLTVLTLCYAAWAGFCAAAAVDRNPTGNLLLAAFCLPGFWIGRDAHLVYRWQDPKLTLIEHLLLWVVISSVFHHHVLLPIAQAHILVVLVYAYVIWRCRRAPARSPERETTR